MIENILNKFDSEVSKFYHLNNSLGYGFHFAELVLRSYSRKQQTFFQEFVLLLASEKTCRILQSEW